MTAQRIIEATHRAIEAWLDDLNDQAKAAISHHDVTALSKSVGQALALDGVQAEPVPEVGDLVKWDETDQTAVVTEIRGRDVYGAWGDGGTVGYVPMDEVTVVRRGGERAATAADLRLRDEPDPKRRVPGMIVDGEWLVLACPSRSTKVVELRMDPDQEGAWDAERRLVEAAGAADGSPQDDPGRKEGPSPEDYERHCPNLRECPACNRWDIVEGFACLSCGEARWDGYEWNDEGQYYELEE